nr:PREDICTED: uncharacterized protein LOC105676860 [Linepithema humile]
MPADKRRKIEEELVHTVDSFFTLVEPLLKKYVRRKRQLIRISEVIDKTFGLTKKTKIITDERMNDDDEEESSSSSSSSSGGGGSDEDDGGEKSINARDSSPEKDDEGGGVLLRNDASSSFPLTTTFDIGGFEVVVAETTTTTNKETTTVHHHSPPPPPNNEQQVSLMETALHERYDTIHMVMEDCDTYHIRPRRTSNEDVLPIVSTRLIRDAFSVLHPLWNQTDIYAATFTTSTHVSKVLRSKNTGATYLKHSLIDTSCEQCYMYDNRYQYWKTLGKEGVECVYSVYLSNDSRKTTLQKNSAFVIPVFTTDNNVDTLLRHRQKLHFKKISNEKAIENLTTMSSTLLCVPTANLFVYIPQYFCEVFMVVGNKVNYDTRSYIVRGFDQTTLYTLMLIFERRDLLQRGKTCDNFYEYR